MLQAFEDTYRREFGFVLEDRDIIVDDLRVRATGKARFILAHVNAPCLCGKLLLWVPNAAHMSHHAENTASIMLIKQLMHHAL